VRGWLTEHTEQIEVFHLPPYSPELNPNEGLNADLKQTVTRKPPARSKQELKRTVISHMRRLTNVPERIWSYFEHQPFRYAAKFKISQAGSIIAAARAQLAAALNFPDTVGGGYDALADQDPTCYERYRACCACNDAIRFNKLADLDCIGEMNIELDCRLLCTLVDPPTFHRKREVSENRNKPAMHNAVEIRMHRMRQKAVADSISFRALPHRTYNGSKTRLTIGRPTEIGGSHFIYGIHAQSDWRIHAASASIASVDRSTKPTQFRKPWFMSS
jgi:hypothetical protein